MERIALIGLGRIAENYVAGINASPRFRLCAVCDLSRAAASADCYAEQRFYDDYKELIANERPDWILLSTPPKTHFEIAAYALSNGVNVLSEKPATVTPDELDALCALAAKEGRYYDVMFHWQYGAEMPPVAALLQKGDLQEIAVEIRDPYSADGESIDDNRQGLCGVWLDSGVNALSMLKTLLAFDRVEIVSVKSQKCRASGQPLFVAVVLQIDGVRVSIIVDWRQHDNPKFSRILLGGKEVFVDHMAQTVTADGKTVDCGGEDRLMQHYRDFFLNATVGASIEDARKIHQILFEVNERL